MNRKTTHFSAIFAAGLLCSTLWAQAVHAGEPSAPPLQVAAVVAAPATQPANQGCFNVSDEAAGFTVQECLTWTRVSQVPSTAAPSIPETMLRQLGAELQWMPQLMPPLNQPGQLIGEYTRQATVRGLETHDMGSHALDLRAEVSGDLVAFTLRLEDHAVRSVEGEVDGAGDGHLTFSYDGAATRTVRFEAGRQLLDAPPAPSHKSSSFYMGCYVDTPAYDPFTPNSCWRLFGSQPTTAVFKVFLPYTPDSVVWFAPLSSCSSVWCSAPISPNQTVTAYAYWVINGIPTGPVVSATAHYDSGL